MPVLSENRYEIRPSSSCIHWDGDGDGDGERYGDGDGDGDGDGLWIHTGMVLVRTTVPGMLSSRMIWNE